RIAAVMMIVSALLQGPVLAYASTVGLSKQHPATGSPCTLPSGIQCDSCCAHGAMPSCAAACTLPSVVAMPSIYVAPHLVLAVRTAVARCAITRLATHKPTEPFRPPIV